MSVRKSPDIKLVQPGAPDGDTKRDQALASALRTLETEAEGLTALKAALSDGLAAQFAEAAKLIHATSGRVIIAGMGKSGHVGRKIAATLSSTGTPAFFVHPSEASHGDLGMIKSEDILLVLSWSGETAELLNLTDYSRRFAVRLIAMTANPDSALARNADNVLLLPKAAEACPHGLAPTTSTLVQLALGDALAVALLEMRGFTAGDFKVIHPGGRLGANLKHVGDIMHVGDSLPLVAPGTVMAEALVTMTQKSLGCLGVVGEDGKLQGVITDGDLRRHMHRDLPARRVEEIMTTSPKTVSPDLLVGAALELLNASRITALFVVEDGRPVGIVHVHDFLRIGVA
ncbi:MAG TPA: KpsF/GutQ family sugar-phosphate isomerase [Hyphomicrobiales bacterium]|nr:KpsF/GutQ family sugar-phosphate isomerase [Hyphomicrobiales bacterium]